MKRVIQQILFIAVTILTFVFLFLIIQGGIKNKNTKQLEVVNKYDYIEEVHQVKGYVYTYRINKDGEIIYFESEEIKD